MSPLYSECHNINIAMRFLPAKTLVRLLCSIKFQAPESLSHCIKHSDLDRIEKNVLLRNHYNNIPLIRNLVDKLQQRSSYDAASLETEVLKLPNDTHPRLWGYGSEPKVLDMFLPKGSYGDNPVEFSDVSKHMNIFRMDHLGNYTGHKSYYLLGKLAELEQALKHYTVKELHRNNFIMLAVPDILPRSVIEGCGMQTEGERTQVKALVEEQQHGNNNSHFVVVYGTKQNSFGLTAMVYKLDSGLCLSGTSEMAIAGYFSNKIFSPNQLPIKVAAVSRCYRAETSGLNEEKGIYRVHQFNKVEMFSICKQNQSEDMIELFKNIQIELFRNLDLKIRLLDMPPMELGAPAFQKYDIEAWMPGRKMWGEISSCSNCTDYQAKRLNIKYVSNNNELLYAHTINGTAAAIPRLLISLIESNQVDKNVINVPYVLMDYISSNIISKERNIPEIKLLKHLKHK